MRRHNHPFFRPKLIEAGSGRLLLAPLRGPIRELLGDRPWNGAPERYIPGGINWGGSMPTLA